MSATVWNKQEVLGRGVTATVYSISAGADGACKGAKKRAVKVFEPRFQAHALHEANVLKTMQSSGCCPLLHAVRVEEDDTVTLELEQFTFTLRRVFGATGAARRGR